MASLKVFLPDPETLLEMEPEGIAPMVLKFFCHDPKQEQWTLDSLISRGNIIQNFAEFGRTHTGELAEQPAVAWNYLETQGLIAPNSGDTNWWAMPPVP